MSYAVVHMQKFSRGSVRGIQSHNQREKPPKTNPDVDLSRSGENYDLLNDRNINYHREITGRGVVKGNVEYRRPPYFGG